MNEQTTIMDAYTKIQRKDIQWDVQWLLNNLFAKLRTITNDACVYGSIREAIYDKWYTAAPDHQAKKAFRDAFTLTASDIDRLLPPLAVDGRGNNNNDSPVAVVEKRSRDDDDASSFADAPTKKPRGDNVNIPTESIAMVGSAAAVSSVSSSSPCKTPIQAVGQTSKIVGIVSKEHVCLKKDDIPSNDDRKRAAVPKIGETAAAHKTSSNEKTHTKLKEALEKCNTDLRNALTMLRDPKNNLFCPPSLREEWCSELTETLNESPPYVIIGCLGGTGVGKSSLLNALLNEADILPTSGSRGCTAAVVELRYNRDFLEPSDQTTVYKANIQFITMENWRADVKFLLDDCCLEGTEQISSDVRNDNEEAKVAWATINSVYGDGTMESYDGNDKATVFDELLNDNRIIELLQGRNGEPNTIVIEEGKVDATKAKQVLDHFRDPRNFRDSQNKRNRKLVREMKSLSKKFRKQINDSVYRKGNGKGPQTWPLIRKVVIRGPWEVLSTGACLVDMPGVRDANAARAKVAENYLQHCHKIWITAPIKRAVDDKTAKDLLGEEFRRRMLMDGQYGNISFICTHSDDCEVSEIMQDHEDVAKSRTGRWEEMVSMRDRSLELDKAKDDLQQKKDDLEIETKELQEIMDIKSEIEECREDEGSDDESNSTLEGLKKSLAAKKKNERDLKAAFYDIDMEWRQNQQKLKAAAAMVRIEFSTKSLQVDFRKGLDEITRSARDVDQGNSRSQATTRNKRSPLPEGFQLEVFCTASNEYLKLQKIKAGSDGPAACFDCAQDTQITDVMDSVHKTTADFRNAYTENRIRASRDVLERIYLCATADQQDSQAAKKFREVFDTKAKDLEKEVDQISAEFCLQMGQMVASELHPSFKRAAVKGNEEAMRIVRSWESPNRRTKLQRGPKSNGLHHTTYNAVMKRHGVFKSQTAGPINLNQELVDPLEKEFSAQWQRTMDAGTTKLLADAEKKLLDCYSRATKTLAESLQVSKMKSERAASLGKAASLSCETAIKGEFLKIYQKQTEKQRSLNRYLLGEMAKKMAPSYNAAIQVPCGQGKFSRQKTALKTKAKIALANNFEPMMELLLQNVALMKNELSAAIRETYGVIEQRLRGVYAVCWSDQEYLEARKRQEVRITRNRLLPEIVVLLKKNEAIMDSLGIRPVATSARQSQQPHAHREPRQEVSASTTGLQHLQSNSKSPALEQHRPLPSPRQTFHGTHSPAHSPPLPIWVLQGRTEHIAYLLEHLSNGWKHIRWASNSKKEWIGPNVETCYCQGGLRSSARQNVPAGPAR